MLFAGAVLAVWLYRYNQTPAVGVVRSSVSPEPKAETVTTVHFRGIAIAFDYPSDYKTVENKPVTQSHTTELYTMNQSDPLTGSKQIAVTVKNLINGPMLEDSAYKFRQIESKTYEISDAALPRYAAKKTVRRDGTEITYFIPGEKGYAIIAATSNRPTDAFRQEITKLAESFVWR